MKKSNLKKLEKLEAQLTKCLDDFIEICDDEEDINGTLDNACDYLEGVKCEISRYLRNASR